MRIVGIDGEPYYTKTDIFYQLRITDIPNFDLKDMIEEEKCEYDERLWFIRGSYDYTSNTFNFDNQLIYICGGEYFYEYTFTNREMLEIIEVCIANTDLSKVYDYGWRKDKKGNPYYISRNNYRFDFCEMNYIGVKNTGLVGCICSGKVDEDDEIICGTEVEEVVGLQYINSEDVYGDSDFEEMINKYN